MSSLFALIRQSLGVAAPASRAVARERLSVMLVHQRNSDVFANIDMDSLQKEVAGVIKKYIKVAQDKPHRMSVKQDGEYDFLEMHFQLDQNSLNLQQGQVGAKHFKATQQQPAQQHLQQQKA